MLRCSVGTVAYGEDTPTGSVNVPPIVRRLFENQQAATLIEYSLIVALIAMATVTGITKVGSGMRNVMIAAANAMN
jgi:Flp pilus assembly pilin Flp